MRAGLLLVAVECALAALYRYGPSRREPKWRWITWGSGLAAVVWIVMSVLFSWYAANFGSYNATYGSLGAIMGFMIWLWLSTIVVLLGAEINAETEHQQRATPLVERQSRSAQGGLSWRIRSGRRNTNTASGAPYGGSRLL